MEEWIMNELYQELIHMPLWTSAAFEKNGEFFFDTMRENLLAYLILQWAKKCPLSEDNYMYKYKISTYMPLIRQAWGISTTQMG
jgi:hypothetical protein